jgi:uncharacterized membrane protein YfcA
MATVLVALLLVAIGCGTGVLAGLLGVGGGVAMVPLLTLGFGLSQQAAEATSLFVILPTSLVATVVLARRRVGRLRVGLTVGVLGAAGSGLGSYLALLLPARTLRYIFAAFMIFVAVRLLGDVYRLRGEPVPD